MLVREFRGKKVKRTRRDGDSIVVVFLGPKGQPGEQVRVPFAEYEKAVQKTVVVRA